MRFAAFFIINCLRPLLMPAHPINYRRELLYCAETSKPPFSEAVFFRGKAA